ncbi:hypothetical protein CC85DRAFT_326899 [Cutaneotrichosporon oleaginosum]|uniref:Mediator of RNA polymerase II transcription subunit 6 n=1 Tax=Cutaneotrichosporon oleaginosum TaxID=879819 RepID=A0A0J0XSF7_9TREE|nr:uncharacterized protein CC85DRAFT_326899 [Cutaneotrichosporon oleaginosum]KLT44002.1 hypothetical protein CC85DRAFT_326899 [Cutaneotrichosporon oleaginosum]TXT04052.1 hypothetical protein COLE_07749 [Cutaneotrichosporon oleaginosum]
MEEDREQDLAHIHWQWPEAIAANPARSLANADLAMDYFAFSPFWDPQSNNGVLRTQNIADPGYGSAQERIGLLGLTGGFEYVVAHARPPDLFVIHRRLVTGVGRRGPPTHAYFILQERIYMAPNLHTVVRTRVGNANALLERTLGMLEAARPPANPRAARMWVAGESKKEDGDEEMKDKEKEEGEDKDKDKDKDKEGKGEGKDKEKSRKEEKEQATPDWHLFNALAATRAALSSVNTLAASSRPAHDAAAEAKTLEALAAATVRPNAPPPQPAPVQPTPLGTPLAGFAALSPLNQGTPSFTPRPRLGSLSLMGGLSRPGSTFAPSVPADSPKLA